MLYFFFFYILWRNWKATTGEEVYRFFQLVWIVWHGAAWKWTEAAENVTNATILVRSRISVKQVTCPTYCYTHCWRTQQRKASYTSWKLHTSNGSQHDAVVNELDSDLASVYFLAIRVDQPFSAGFDVTYLNTAWWNSLLFSRFIHNLQNIKNRKG